LKLTFYQLSLFFFKKKDETSVIFSIIVEYFINMNLSVQSFYYDLLNRFSHSYTRRIIIEAFNLFLQLWPYLVAGIIITSIIKVYLTKQQIASFFQKKKNLSIIISALLGVISPLGSYVVIPLGAALFLIGTPMPVIIAFLVSSPLIDPNLFILTAGAFGFEMAFARVFAALFIGIASGYLLQWMLKKKIISDNNIINQQNIDNIKLQTNYENSRKINVFFNELYKMTKYISKYFFLALFLAALIKIISPTDFLTKIFSKNIFISVLISTSAGVPFYTCGGAAIPVVQQLAELGLSKGAILAFFISGPITKISNIILMKAAFSTKVFLFYILIGFFGALFFGILYNYL